MTFCRITKMIGGWRGEDTYKMLSEQDIQCTLKVHLAIRKLYKIQ